jgi:hypothetical protein
MEYQPKFKKYERDGRVSLWVVMPNGEEWNIWDIDETNSRVESAVISAFERGFSASRMSTPNIPTCTLQGFEDMKCSI